MGRPMFVRDSLRELSPRHVVVDSIEERFEVDVHRPPASVPEVLLCRAHRLVALHPGRKPWECCEKLGSRRGCHTCKMAWLPEPIEHARDAKGAHAAVAFRYRVRLDWLWPVAARQGVFLHCQPMLDRIGRQLLHGHPVDPETALVLPDAFQCRL